MIGRLVALVVCVLAVVGVYFVAEHWQDRPDDAVVVYEPGTYLGAPDTPLDAAQEDELRARVRNQNQI